MSTGRAGGWAAFPGIRPDGVLLLEAFGRLSSGDGQPAHASEEWDLYGAFSMRSEMMRWSATSEARRGGRPLWSMHEAELCEDPGDPRIGWAQVGIAPGTAPGAVVPAMIQCLDDSLHRFGVVEMSGLQVTASHLQPSDDDLARDSAMWIGWFNMQPGDGASAVVSTDERLIGRRSESEWLASLGRMGERPFTFESVVPVSGEQAIQVAANSPTGATLSPAHHGVTVRLPEWSPASAGWVLAFVIETALSDTSATSDFAVRLTKAG